MRRALSRAGAVVAAVPRAATLAGVLAALFLLAAPSAAMRERSYGDGPIARAFANFPARPGSRLATLDHLTPKSGAWRSDARRRASAAAGRRVDGTAEVLYRARANDAIADHDIFVDTDVVVEDLVPGIVRGGLWLRQDYEANRRWRRGDDFFQLEDFQEQRHLRLYRGYVDVTPPGLAGATLRAGRQWIEEVGNHWVDGGSIRVPLLADLGLTLFGGRSVSMYSDASGDWAGGAAVTWAPSVGRRYQLSYVHDRDDEFDTSDSVLALEAWHTVTDGLRVHARGSLLDGKIDQVQLDASWQPGSLPLHLYGEWFHLARDREGETNFHNPYTRAGLQTWMPHDRFTLGAFAQLTSWLSVVANGTVKNHRDGVTVPESYSNADMVRADLIATAALGEHWTLEVGGYYWDADLRDGNWSAWGELRFRPVDELSTAVGVRYRGHRFGWYDVTSQQRVRQGLLDEYVYHLEVEYGFRRWGRVGVRVDFEDPDGIEDAPYVTAELLVRVAF